MADRSFSRAQTVARAGSWMRTALRMSTALLSIACFVSSLRAQTPSSDGNSTTVVAAVVPTTVPHVTVNLSNVPLARALEAIAQEASLQVIYRQSTLPATHVTLHVRDVPAGEAFGQVLQGTGLVARIRAPGAVVIAQLTAADSTGTIRGAIVDAKTHTPVSGATVMIDEGARRAVARDDGSYQIDGLSAGAHRVAVRSLRYTAQKRLVHVEDGKVATEDFVLFTHTTALDQVVVTGTAAPTDLKAVPNAITVITAKQIQDRGITRIEQLFRGDVPGLFVQNSGSTNALDQVTMYARGGTSVEYGSPTTNYKNTNAIKTYIDGVEMSDPSYMSQIDPQSIERIEILTGPQASTIYGSNALNGVMQIFTKRGTTQRPRIIATLISGQIQNNFRSSLTPVHDYSAQVTGASGHMSYSTGGSWNYVGPWTPAKQTSRLGGFGGARMQYGMFTGDFNLRLSKTRNIQRGDQFQTGVNYYETGWYGQNNSLFTGVVGRTTGTLDGQTLGLTLGFKPTHWWSHELVVGQDFENSGTFRNTASYSLPQDTGLYISATTSTRSSARYTTSLQGSLTPWAHVVISGGGDEWKSVSSYRSASPQKLTGTIVANDWYETRTPDHNAGGFIQAQLGMWDALFLTYGLRGEWNPNFGDEAQPNLSPRYGIVYSRTVGPVTAKFRGSFGRSTRPPTTGMKDPLSLVAVYGAELAARYKPVYGDINFFLANPELGPETQEGTETGVDLYFGNYGSLTVTRYDQKINNLIVAIVGDSARSLIPNPDPSVCSPHLDGYCYQNQSQYVNVGNLRNQGWESQLTINAGPLTTTGTFSYTKSRVASVAPKYRKLLAGRTQYEPGSSLNGLAEHTWALGVRYASRATSLGITFNGTGALYRSFDETYVALTSSFIRLNSSKASLTDQRTIWPSARYVMADLTGTRRVARAAEIVLQIQNLGNYYRSDADPSAATIGRQSKIGLRLTY